MKVSPRTIALLVTYHGANFKGYARQPQRRTVQALLEESWFQVSGERVTMLASGRTDSGVHALGQVVHFETATDFEIEKVARALNSNFDSDCVVRQAVVQSSEFHASESAQLKHYIYQIALGSTPPVLGNEFCYWVPQRLDLSAMRTAMQSFIGTHDYESFAASGRTTSTTVRTVTNIHIQIKRDRLLIHVRGTGFLYKMVRNMVGSLLEIGRGRHSVDWISKLLLSKDRRRAGATAPANGLVLYRVHYREEPFSELHNRSSLGYSIDIPNN